MALRNAVNIATTTHTFGYSGWAAYGSFNTGQSGSPDSQQVNSHDDDFATWWGCYSQGGFVSTLATAEHVFPSTYYITNIKVKLYSQSNRQIYWDGSYRTPNYVRIKIRQSGTWETLYDDTQSAINFGVDYDESDGWLCDGIRVEVKSSSEFHLDDDAYCSSQIFEVQAFFVPFDDIGIRVKSAYGAGVISIGVQDLEATHKLRIRGADGVTYGIPLLATDDIDATPVRIYDGTNVKALPGVN